MRGAGWAGYRSSLGLSSSRGIDGTVTDGAGVYSFCLREPADRESFRIGDEVALWGPSVPPPKGAV